MKALLCALLILVESILICTADVVATSSNGDKIDITGSPSKLTPPYLSEITTNADGGSNDFNISLKDSTGKDFNFRLENKDIIFSYADIPLSKPGSSEEQTLLTALKQVYAQQYNPTLEKQIDFPYTYGETRTSLNQLALKFAVRLLEIRCQTKAVVDPAHVDFYPHQSERTQIDGLYLAGLGWKEIQKPSELYSPCSIMDVETLMSDDENFYLYLRDDQKHVLSIGYGNQDLYLNGKKSKPGDDEEQILLKILTDAFAKVNDPSLDSSKAIPDAKSDLWFDQNGVQKAIAVLQLRCQTKTKVPDRDVEAVFNKLYHDT